MLELVLGAECKLELVLGAECELNLKRCLQYYETPSAS